jgi:hypothetical protein
MTLVTNRKNPAFLKDCILTPPTEFFVTLTPTPDPSDPSGYRRLRKALKVLLRSFGLRCVDITQRAEPLELDNEPGKVSDR